MVSDTPDRMAPEGVRRPRHRAIRGRFGRAGVTVLCLFSLTLIGMSLVLLVEFLPVRAVVDALPVIMSAIAMVTGGRLLYLVWRSSIRRRRILREGVMARAKALSMVMRGSQGDEWADIVIECEVEGKEQRIRFEARGLELDFVAAKGDLHEPFDVLLDPRDSAPWFWANSVVVLAPAGANRANEQPRQTVRKVYDESSPLLVAAVGITGAFLWLMAS